MDWKPIQFAIVRIRWVKLILKQRQEKELFRSINVIQVYIDQPTNIAQCYSKLKFYNQINANYDIVYGFVNQESAKHCDYTTYRGFVNDMKTATFRIVDSYFNCVKRDCLPRIMAAHKKYMQVLLTKFAPYLSCSYTYFSPDCAVNIKHATYFSAENIMSTIIQCAKLKATCQRPDWTVLLKEFRSKQTVDCNCVKIVSFSVRFYLSFSKFQRKCFRTKDQFLLAKTSVIHLSTLQPWKNLLATILAE